MCCESRAVSECSNISPRMHAGPRCVADMHVLFQQELSHQAPTTQNKGPGEENTDNVQISLKTQSLCK